jgi:membrane protein implicated in regulation of membrane protease activity
MDTSPETWQWVWLVVALVLIGGEIIVPGTFILLPFGISAAIAAVMSVLGVSAGWTWLVFILVGVALFVVMWHYARRWAVDAPMPIGVGADRMVGGTGSIVVDVPASPTGSGEVLIRGELWRAESHSGAPIGTGTVVEIIAVRGTRVIVTPVAQTAPDGPSPDEGARP